MTNDTATRAWLVLMFQLPARPTAARVRTWRQLQRLGALSVRNSGYVLPDSDQSREDFEWLRADIQSSGGGAMLLRAQTLDPAAEAELVSAFRDAKRAELEALRQAAVVARPARRGRRPTAADAREVRGLLERLARIENTDLFGGVDAARAAARAAVAALGPGEHVMAAASSAAALKIADFKGRTWVTRPRPGIDRFASAWLVSRFIDPRAKFGFAASPAAVPPRQRATTFDMYGGAFTHQGGGCTFETLVARFGIRAAGVDWLAGLVHALDLKIESDTAPELPAVARLVEGLRDMHPDDEVLLRRGMEVIEALYRSRLAQSFRTVRPAKPPGAPRATASRRGAASASRAKRGR